MASRWKPEGGSHPGTEQAICRRRRRRSSGTTSRSGWSRVLSPRTETDPKRLIALLNDRVNLDLKNVRAGPPRALDYANVIDALLARAELEGFSHEEIEATRVARIAARGSFRGGMVWTPPDPVFHIAHEVPRRIRLKSATLKGDAPAGAAAEACLADLPGICSARANPLTGNLTVVHDGSAASRKAIMRALERFSRAPVDGEVPHPVMAPSSHKPSAENLRGAGGQDRTGASRLARHREGDPDRRGRATLTPRFCLPQRDAPAAAVPVMAWADHATGSGCRPSIALRPTRLWRRHPERNLRALRDLVGCAPRWSGLPITAGPRGREANARRLLAHSLRTARAGVAVPAPVRPPPRSSPSEPCTQEPGSRRPPFIARGRAPRGGCGPDVHHGPVTMPRFP